RKSFRSRLPAPARCGSARSVAPSAYMATSCLPYPPQTTGRRSANAVAAGHTYLDLEGVRTRESLAQGPEGARIVRECALAFPDQRVGGDAPVPARTAAQRQRS